MFFRKSSRSSVFETEALPHAGELFRASVRLLGGDRDGAQDLVQDVLAKAWASFRSYRPGTNCRAWLYSILMNEVRHHRRRLATGKVIPISMHGDGELLDKTPHIPPLPASITDEEILAGLDKLPEEYRDVVLLADAQGFAYKEIAEMLGIPVGTVMSRLSRGRKALRKELRAVAHDYGIESGSANTNL